MITSLVLGSVVALHSLRPETVAVDASDAAAAYAVGSNWKARFGADGVRFTPFLGSDAPRNEWVRFEPSRVTIDGVALASNPEAGVVCTGHSLRYERGAFDEVFEARLDGLEHQLTFNALPARGELVVRCPVDSSLTARQTSDAIEFTNERGGVRYPNAVAFDAAGHRLVLATRLEGTALAVTVPREFVARAELPLTIDPLIQVFGVATGPAYEFAPDVSFQQSGIGDIRCEVYETAWSTADHDVTARVTRSVSGTVTTVLVDATTEYWAEPKVASIVDSKVTTRFAVVAAVGLPASGARTIRCRDIFVVYASTTLGPVTAVGPAITGDNHTPDIGGDPWAQSPTFSYFFVAWQRDEVNGDSDIFGSAYPSSQQPYAVAVDPQSDDERPRVSKSNGATLWCAAWERRVSPGNRDIWASTLQYQGAAPSAPILISNSPEDESAPSVSSLGLTGNLIAYTRDMGGQHDVFLQVLGTTAGPAIDFTLLEGGTHLGLNQMWPVVDGSNSGYLLAYRDDDPVNPGFERTRLTSFQLSPTNQIVLSEIRHSIGETGNSRAPANVCSHAASSANGFGPARFEVVWDELPTSTNGDVTAAIFVDGAFAGAVTSACYGDGSLTACPCAQNGGAPAGCPNSSQATGGELQWTGVADVSGDTFVIHALRLTPNAPVVITGGSAFGAGGIVYGDGLLCIGGALVRLVYRVTSPTGTLTYPEVVTDLSISAAGGVPVGGGTQNYQLVFRDAAAFCAPGTFNTTNALRVNWAP